MEGPEFSGQGRRRDVDQSRTVRVLRMASLLQQREMRVPELMNLFGVARRTVYRDLKLIDAAGVLSGSGTGKTYRPTPSKRLSLWAEVPQRAAPRQMTVAGPLTANERGEKRLTTRLKVGGPS